MSDDVITPGQSGGSPTEATRKAVGGWKAMQQGKQLSRQERLLKEQREGKPASSEDANYKPGDEEGNGEFNLRKAKDHISKMNKTNLAAKTFKGNAQLCCIKMEMLFNGDEDHQAARNLTIVKVEDAGLGMFKITYTCD